MAKKKWGTGTLILFVVGIIVLTVGILIVHWFIYPFSSATPNFADVEATFNKLQIPSDWQVIDESENRGLAGRQCPVEPGSMCFHVSKTFKVPSSITQDTVKQLIQSSGCVSSAFRDDTYEGDPEGSKYSLECVSGAVRVVVSVNIGKESLYVRTSSQ